MLRPRQCTVLDVQCKSSPTRTFRSIKDPGAGQCRGGEHTSIVQCQLTTSCASLACRHAVQRTAGALHKVGVSNKGRTKEVRLVLSIDCGRHTVGALAGSWIAASWIALRGKAPEARVRNVGSARHPGATPIELAIENPFRVLPISSPAYRAFR